MAQACRRAGGESVSAMPVLFACHRTTNWMEIGRSRRPSREERAVPLADVRPGRRCLDQTAGLGFRQGTSGES